MGGIRSLVARLAISRGWPQTRGTIHGLALRDRVEVRRDRWGVPHITASNPSDLLYAQGFVHAQDRLWQMESLRRLSEGRLSEIAGTATLDLDFFCRMIGMPEMKQRVCATLSGEDLSLVESYVAGVNGYLRVCGKRLPFEFGSLGFEPEPWSVESCASVLPYLSWWLLFQHYAEKLLAIAAGRRLSLHEWNDLFPSHPDARMPPDPFFETLARLKLGELHPGALGFHAGLGGDLAPEARRAALQTDALKAPLGGGSNNWVVAKGSDGYPLLANDPHLGVAVPPVWHFCHLSVPGSVNVAGCSLPGVPGVIIGRTEEAAWGLTNVCLDAADILLFRVLPENPRRYRIGDRVLDLRQRQLRFGVRGGPDLTLPLYETESGPVITAVRDGVEAVAVLKWYGTLSNDSVTDRSFRGVFSFMRARSAADVLEAARHWSYASQNFVAADRAGHIGWHASGAAPIRNGYTGRLPADGTAGAEWTGFLSFESLPQSRDPKEGWIATANFVPAGYDAPLPLSYSWMPPYRLERITEGLSRLPSPTIEDFQRLQMDLHSAQADRILPKALAFPFTDPEAARAAEILRVWDHEVRADSAGAALYELFLFELERRADRQPARGRVRAVPQRQGLRRGGRDPGPTRLTPVERLAGPRGRTGAGRRVLGLPSTDGPPGVALAMGQTAPSRVPSPGRDQPFPFLAAQSQAARGTRGLQHGQRGMVFPQPGRLARHDRAFGANGGAPGRRGWHADHRPHGTVRTGRSSPL